MNEMSKTDTIITVVMAVISALIILSGAYFIVRDAGIQKGYQPISATVTGANRYVSGSARHRSTSYSFQLEYSVGDKNYVYVTGHYTDKRYYEGQTVHGWYKVKRPSRFLLRSPIFNDIDVIVFGVLVIILNIGHTMRSRRRDDEERCKSISMLTNGPALITAAFLVYEASQGIMHFDLRMCGLCALALLVWGVVMIVRGIFYTIDLNNKYSSW